MNGPEILYKDLVYPLIRLPQSYAHLTGKTAHIFKIDNKGTPLFIISLDEDFDSEIEVIQPTTKSDLETRVEYLENKLKNLEKSISEDDKKSGGPAEIRTQDPRRVKAMS